MKTLRLAALGLLLLLAPALAGAADAVPIGTLLQKAPVYDGSTVTVEGEALGDVMLRGNYGWINIGDETGVIGIWAPAGALQAIRRTGSYGAVGDRVRVTGTFYRAAADLGGDTAIVADTLSVVQPGRGRERPVSGLRVLFGLAATALAAVLVFIWRRRPVG